MREKVATLVLLVASLPIISLALTPQDDTQAEREAMYYRYLEFASYVKGGSITPHWMADGSSFWYAEDAPANTVIWKVDPKANTKVPLFGTARLRQALTALLGHEPPHQGLPFVEFTFVDDGEKAVKFTVESKEFILQLDTYATSQVPALSEEEKNRMVPQVVRKGVYGWPDVREVLSPDGRWFASLKDHNLWLRSTYDGRSMQVTTDDVEDYEWNAVRWSPDSLKLAVRKVDERHAPKSPIVHWLKPTEEIEWVHREGPGRQFQLFVVDILSKRQIRVDTGDEPLVSIIRWRPDGSELFFLRADPLLKKLDLMAADPTTGTARVILAEAGKTFVIGLRFDVWPRLFTLLEDAKRFIWISERDGWNHLYLYSLDGALIRRLTEGAFPVVKVEAVDEKAGWVYFSAHGDQRRPYDTHLYRVTLEGKGFTRLTEATGEHHIQFSPSKEFFLDTHSSVDRPPVTELRKADGTLLATLSKANIDALQELKWEPPEQFVVKAADGKTDLYGVLYKPYDFDLSRKYPVIEVIYAGPQFSEVPHAFTHPHGLDYHAEQGQALAQLGFIAFVVDGRGTPERGKEFQDVVYRSFGRNEIPDHVATLTQLGEKRPYMDLSRVGILGHSWGGYFAIRALLVAPDVYHVGIAISPGVSHETISAIYMDLQQNNKEGYEFADNLRLAGNLKGNLLLIHGTSDINAPFSETVKMVEALIRAGQPYDLIMLPEQDHWPAGTSRTYMREAIRRYFQEHLKP